MPKVNWTYTLRLLKRNPERITMDRLAEYMRVFSELLGTENKPVFKGIKRASTGLRAAVPAENQKRVALRLISPVTQVDSDVAKSSEKLELMMGCDGIPGAELRDVEDNVIRLFSGTERAVEPVFRVQQSGTIDGEITGVRGADDTIHVYVRDSLNRDLTIICRDFEVSRQLLQRFRLGSVRLNVHGSWERGEHGWLPETNKCYLDSFEDLDDMSALEVFRALNKIPNNGWKSLADPIAEWENLRGISK